MASPGVSFELLKASIAWRLLYDIKTGPTMLRLSVALSCKATRGTI